MKNTPTKLYKMLWGGGFMFTIVCNSNISDFHLRN